jgi:hypothetical protein
MTCHGCGSEQLVMKHGRVTCKRCGSSRLPDTTGLGLAGLVQGADQARENSHRKTKARALTPKGKFL